ISIFMTHLSNYGNDRLGLYTFANLASFVKSSTNLKLQTLPPVQLAQKYFELFPEQTDPLWQVKSPSSSSSSCSPLVGTSIFSSKNYLGLTLAKRCRKFPLLFLARLQRKYRSIIFPLGCSNSHQLMIFPHHILLILFTSKVYMDFFPTPSNITTDLLFEKSANY
ncbi:NDST3 sulfotransferase, partial [Horornis vulcanius]|nr:NDST3 sulfotransferase [Horornis vulcanius]